MPSLGEAPIIVQIDTREQRPLVISGYDTERATLPVGDYGIKGFSDWDNPNFVMERKSLDDLCNSLGNGHERFYREIEKMRQFRWRGLIIEAYQAELEMHQYHSFLNPKSAQAMLDSMILNCGIHVFWSGSAAGAASQLCGLIRQFVRKIQKDYRRLGVKA